MYRVELIGFGNFDRRSRKTLEEAREEVKKTAKETYEGRSTDYPRKKIQRHWTSWEIWYGRELVDSGDFQS